MAEPIAYIRISSRSRFPIKNSSQLARDAYQWNRVLQKRSAWQRRRTSLPKKCHKTLLDIGVPRAALEKIVKAKVIEVQIPYTKEDEGWAARIFPWEYVIAQATKFMGRQEDLTVVRHLDRKGVDKVAPPRKNLKTSIISSAPGIINESYDFSTEIRLVSEALYPRETSSTDHAHIEIIKDPSYQSLRKSLNEFKPDIVHFGGVDNQQGYSEFRILRKKPKEEQETTNALTLDQSNNSDRSKRKTKESERLKILDGIVLTNEKDRAPELVECEDIAKGIAGGTGRDNPYLVAFNTYFSASRTAALTVAEGANFAIGFQDRIDDDAAEAFFTYFYKTLSGGVSDVLENEDQGEPQREAISPHLAFGTALKHLFDMEFGLSGACVVFWSRVSIFEDSHNTAKSFKDNSGRLLAKALQPFTGTKPADAINNVEVKPKRTLNYSLLHNHQPLFESFVIEKSTSKKIDNVFVKVELDVGPEKPSYRRRLALVKKRTHLERDIFVPLTWIRNLTASESIRSTLHVEISVGDQLIHANSYSATILSPQDWADSDTNRQSLPSFVYPRDPAIKQVIQAGEKYLASLTGDFVGGFDGYQSVYEENGDVITTGVDLQVEAIWNALVRDFSISYINPPPSFTYTTQRLRLPSDVINNRRGTCIDLSLLMCACLEYIDIYPVMFMLEGHAFFGYWRSSQSHEAFLLSSSIEMSDGVDDTVWQNAAWLFEGDGAYDDVLNQIRLGNLVPIESIWMTQKMSLEAAVDEGWHNLANKSEFHSLTDILTARFEDVTPLPIHHLQ